MLLQLAEAGHGVAIIPSILRATSASSASRASPIGGDPLLLKLAVLWDRQRTLPRYAQEFSELLAEHIREHRSRSARRGAEKLAAGA